MNRDQIEGKWKRFTGSARERRGKLAGNDWEAIAGKKDRLVGRIQERYGVAKATPPRAFSERARERPRTAGWMAGALRHFDGPAFSDNEYLAAGLRSGSRLAK
jgi:uncharacterized protein YjbJ (UPF0337 family)